MEVVEAMTNTTLQQQSQFLERHYVIPHPFMVVDAAIREYLTRHPDPNAPQATRLRLSEGSTRYTLSQTFEQATVGIADINVRAVSSAQTYIAIDLRPLRSDTTSDQVTYLEDWAKFQLLAFLAWLWADQKRMSDLANNTPTPDNSKVVSLNPIVIAPGILKQIKPNPGGRPSNEDDDWAWHEVNVRHRAAKVVRQEWDQRITASGRFLVDIERTWRNAINPNRHKKKGRRKPD
jgi:hypothetical protein